MLSDVATTAIYALVLVSLLPARDHRRCCLLVNSYSTQAVVSLVSGFMGYSIMQNNQKLMNYLNSISTGTVVYVCFALTPPHGEPRATAGVILAAAFTHLLPDAVSDLSDFDYPVAEACSLTGFLLLVLVETSMQYIQYEEDHKVVKTEHTGHDCADHDYAAGVDVIHSDAGKLRASSIARIQQEVSIRNEAVSECVTCDIDIGDPHDRLFGKESSKYGSFTHPAANSDKGHDHEHGHSHGNDHQHEPKKDVESAPLLLRGHSDEQRGYSHSHGHSHDHTGEKKGLKITQTGAYTLWAALMVHSTLEGFGVGVTSSVQQGAIVFAILIHKGFESLALNSALLEAKIPYPMYLLLYGIFCLSIPVGAMVGALLKTSGSSVFSGVITGLASGSFMYIGTMEMLPTTLSSCENMLLAIALFIGSAACMAGLAGVV